jgi:hypothetical protein
VGAPSARWGAALLAACALVSAGCQKKVAQCNELVRVINQGVEALEKRPPAEGEASAVADLASLADTMERAAGDAAKVELSVPELAGLSSEYQAMARGVAKAARDMAAAVEAKDEKKMAAAEEAMQAAAKLEEPMIERLNRLCQDP